MRGAIIFVGFWRPPMPPPLPDATILSHLNDSERGAPLSVVGFWRPQCPPPSSTDATMLTVLMTERGGAMIFYRIVAPPPPPPDPDATVLKDIGLQF